MGLLQIDTKPTTILDEQTVSVCNTQKATWWVSYCCVFDVVKPSEHRLESSTWLSVVSHEHNFNNVCQSSLLVSSGHCRTAQFCFKNSPLFHSVRICVLGIPPPRYETDLDIVPTISGLPQVEIKKFNCKMSASSWCWLKQPDTFNVTRIGTIWISASKQNRDS